MSILFPEGSNNFTLSLKLILISTGVLSAAVALKLSAPAITEFAVSEVPSLYHGVVSWLKPPYLYLVINCIIITIVASSKLQSAAKLHHDVTPPLPTHPQLQPTLVQVAYYQPQPQPVPLVVPHLRPREFADVDQLAEAAVTSVRAPPEPEVYEQDNDIISSISNINSNYYGNKQVLVDDNGKEEFVGVNEVADALAEVVALSDGGYGNESNYAAVSKSPWSSTSTSPGISRMDSLELSLSSNEKPPVSSRFGHRRTAKASPDQGGKAALGVSKPRRHDTLESTWRTITEGRAMPLTRHLRKSDTWETHSGRHHPNQALQNPKMMVKSETFADRSSKTDASSGSGGGGGSKISLLSPSPGSGKLKREPSLSQDELNRRVEAFIKKFNEEMRLQRQESLNQYREMINRGAH